MSGLAVQVEAQGIVGLQARLNRLAGLNTAEILDAIGATVESQARRRIQDDKAGPDGEAWPEWSDAYAASRHGGHSLLQGEGHLLDSLTYHVQTDHVEVGSNLIYAAIQQFGGEEVGMPVPARPFLGISPDDERELGEVIDDFVDRALGL